MKMNQVLPKYAKFIGDHSTKENRCLEYVLKNAKQNDSVSVYKTIDEFCTKDKNWMMNVGPDKGVIIDNLIKEKSAKAMLELGTYMGYSAIRFSQLLSENGVFVTVDVNPKTNRLAKVMAEFAGANNIDFLLGGIQGNIENLKKKYPQGFDLIFLDHVKSLYIPDLNILEKAGLVREGTRVISDNLVYPGCPQMFEYMKGNEHYSTKYYDSVLEYTDIKDTFGCHDCVKGFK
jgi:catechol O-methyltransferase